MNIYEIKERERESLLLWPVYPTSLLRTLFLSPDHSARGKGNKAVWGSYVSHIPCVFAPSPLHLPLQPALSFYITLLRIPKRLSGRVSDQLIEMYCSDLTGTYAQVTKRGSSGVTNPAVLGEDCLLLALIPSCFRFHAERDY